jgi:two-component system chemotaxis sensor kinase CheA
VSTLFNRFHRLVHDLAAESGREVRLVTEGGETELDRSLLDLLADPLMHLVRNCVAHGIETPGERTARGKSPWGTIRLTAGLAGDQAVLQVSDDGAGLDREAIRRRAAAMGLVAGERHLDDDQSADLVFAGGLSTARRVTTLAGRGVGMDAVRRDVEMAGGTVGIGSNPGAGVTVTIRVPLPGTSPGQTSVLRAA